MPTYFIHDNRARPYKVVVVKKYVKIYKELDYDEYTDSPIFEYHPKKIFIGRSGLNEMTKQSGDSGPDFDGNSILLKMSKLNYIYIGDEIKSFTSYAEITRYLSYVGNNDVPYPYAIDRDKNYYLMIENVVLNNVPPHHRNDIYHYYYNVNLMTVDEGWIPPRQPLIKNFHDIDKFYIGNEQYTMRYRPSPSKNYDSENSPFYIKPINGKKYVLTKKMYISLMRSFGRKIGARAIKRVKIIQPRDW